MSLTENIDAARSINGIPFSEIELPYSSLGQILVTNAQQTPDKEWLVYYDLDGKRTSFTYSEFLKHVNAVARFLLERGVTRGSRIATVTHNHWETVAQYFAAWMIGATIVPVNVGEDDERVEYILVNSKATLAFVRDEYLPRVEKLRPIIPTLKHIVVCGGEDSEAEYEHFDSIVASRLNAPIILPRIRLLSQECMIVYTSGTTGNPKGVLLTQGNLMADAKGISEWHNVRNETRMMCVLPIHHVNGTVVTLATPLFVGATIVLNRKFQTQTFFPRTAEEKVEIVSVVPTLLAFLSSKELDIQDHDLSNFRHIICGAGPLTCELAERFETMYDIPIIHGYGLSETTCYSCFLPTDQSNDERRGWLTDHGFPSIGLPIPQNEMAIHDEAGNALGPNERGEIVIRGHNVMTGYYNNEEANAQAFEHGWFRSGDEGFYLEGQTSEEHFFFITGRLKELIIRGGVNISPLEIDEVLNSHPKVEAAIAVGFENSWYGEEIGAYVHRNDNSLTEEELIDYCAKELPFSKLPKVIVFGDDIPVTSTGKYQRNRVKHLFLDHKEAQFQKST